jgi:hypothetical protein
MSFVPVLPSSATQRAGIEEDKQKDHDRKEDDSNQEPSCHDAVSGLNRRRNMTRDLLHVDTPLLGLLSYRGRDDGKHQNHDLPNASGRMTAG